MNLFNLFATLTLDNSDYEKKLDQSQKSAGSFSSKVGTAFKTSVRAVAGFVAGVTAATAAIGALVVKFVDAGSEIDDNSQKLGISTEAYQYWSLVLQRAGSDASNLSMMIRNMTTFTQELSEGNADALLTLQDLGIGYEDFMAMNTEEQLYAIVEALQSMENQTDKVQIAQEIFGTRTYQELLPLLNMEQGSLQNLQNEFESLGLIMSEDTVKSIAEVGDSLDNLGNLIKTTGLVIASGFLPEINEIIDGLTGIVTSSVPAEEAIQSISDAVTSVISKLGENIPQLVNIVGNLFIAIIEGLVNTISNPETISALVKVLESLIKKVIEIIPTLLTSIGNIAVAFINALLNVNWGDLILTLVNTLFDFVIKDLPKATERVVQSIFDTLSKLFSKDGLNSLAEFGMSLAEAIINGLISGVESGVNLLINGLNEILDGISSIWTWIGIPAIPDIPTATLPRVDFAEGGMFPDAKGTLYALAGESGAEIVARGARGTGVANVEQIADAQYMALNDYDLRGAIQQAAVAVVNGIVSGLGNNTQSGGNTPVIVRIGDKDFNGYIVNTVNGTLRAQGRKSLNKVTAYGKG